MLASASSADSLGTTLDSFLADSPHAAALENGERLFDFATARYSVSREGKCVLHLWSDERNAVLRVLDAELKPRLLRLSVLRFGQSQPTILEISADRSDPLFRLCPERWLELLLTRASSTRNCRFRLHRSRDNRRAHLHPRQPTRHPRTQGRGRHPPPAARTRLLGALAPT
jgi:hypothetical protein